LSNATKNILKRILNNENVKLKNKEKRTPDNAGFMLQAVLGMFVLFEKRRFDYFYQWKCKNLRLAEKRELGN
jgi:hypothetical protein